MAIKIAKAPNGRFFLVLATNSGPKLGADGFATKEDAQRAVLRILGHL